MAAEEPKRAVLDTNVVVSALVWGGKPFAFFEAAFDGDVRLFTSSILLEELRDVLTRSHIAERLKKRRATAEQAIALYAAIATTVTPALVAPVILEDPDDDHVIAAAIGAKADFIVSGDKHLLKLATYLGIRIVSPADAIGILAQR